MILGQEKLGETTTLLGAGLASGGRTEQLTGISTGGTASTTTQADAKTVEAKGKTVESSSQSNSVGGGTTALSGDSVSSGAFAEATGGATLVVMLSPVGAVANNNRVTAFGLKTELTSSGTVSDPFTTVTAVNELRLGDTTFGNNQLGKPQNFATSIEMSGSLSDSLSEAFDGSIVELKTDTEVSDALSESIAGVTQSLSGSTFSGDSISLARGQATLALLTSDVHGAIRFLPDWTLGQKVLGDTIEEVRNWNVIEITLRVDRNTVVNDIRPLTTGVGAVDVISTSDGGYEVVKRGGNNEITLKASTDRNDVRPVTTWYLQDITEEVIGTEAEEYEVTLEAIPEKEKAFDNSLGNLTSPFPNNTRDIGFWKYDFEAGSIETERVTADIEREPTNELKSITLSFLAEPEEVRIMEENLSKLNALAERSVPDGTNIVEDTTFDKRHIVNITPPDSATDTVEPGEYYVTEWETEYLQSRAYMVEMTIVNR